MVPNPSRIISSSLFHLLTWKSWAKCSDLCEDVGSNQQDTLNVFPLISVTLGDNMAAVIPKRWTRGGRKATWKLVCRFGASLPPLLISMFVSDLSVTLQISGLMGIYVAFFAPALLQLQASREFPTSNIYSGKFSGVGYVYGVLIFGTMALIVLLYQLVLQVAG
ncbi:unnamed protein product [Phytophthora fragariaefolia]|uniref:Unnamed protein product n=1 Tax=Phytophthora fragariaefolia TaxID=1490495 RepID=A0A9W6YG57_9STRA|nr:unnamed protein product [Phytophthora fragariaefolia]